MVNLNNHIPTSSSAIKQKPKSLITVVGRWGQFQAGAKPPIREWVQLNPVRF